MSRLTRNQRYSIARAWMHDRVCTSAECRGDGDHALRTQHGFARAAANAPTLDDLAGAIHAGCCLNGDQCDTTAHLSHLEPFAADLWARLGNEAA